MVWHNNPDQYRGIEPAGEHIIGSADYRETLDERRGLFYRNDPPYSQAELGARLDAADSAAIQDYQYWVELGWKAEHASEAAVERFSDKLYEELGEFKQAILPLELEATLSVAERKELISEMGDVLWCVTALACCLSADIDAGLKNRLFRYVSGVSYADGGGIEQPAWRPVAAAMATKFGQLTNDEIENLVGNRFEPLPSPVMNLSDPEDTSDTISGHVLMLYGVCIALKNECLKYYGMDEDDSKSYMLHSMLQDHALRASELSAEAYLILAYLAQTAGFSFSDIIRENFNKLSGRIKQGLVDKSDGARE